MFGSYTDLAVNVVAPKGVVAADSFAPPRREAAPASSAAGRRPSDPAAAALAVGTSWWAAGQVSGGAANEECGTVKASCRDSPACALALVARHVGAREACAEGGAVAVCAASRQQPLRRRTTQRCVLPAPRGLPPRTIVTFLLPV